MHNGFHCAFCTKKIAVFYDVRNTARLGHQRAAEALFSGAFDGGGQRVSGERTVGPRLILAIFMGVYFRDKKFNALVC